MLWSEVLLALLRIPNIWVFFLVLSTLRVLPLVELRLIEGEECPLPFCGDKPSGSAVDIVLVWIALMNFLWAVRGQGGVVVELLGELTVG